MRAHRPLFVLPEQQKAAKQRARRVSRRAKPTSSGRARGREGTKKNQLRFDRFPLNPTCAPTTPIKKKDERAIFARDEKKNKRRTQVGVRVVAPVGELVGVLLLLRRLVQVGR